MAESEPTIEASTACSAWDFGRYIIAGAVAYGVELISYRLLLWWEMHPYWANPTTHIIACIAAFFIHKHYTFQNRGSAHVVVQTFRYTIVCVISLVISQAAIWCYLEIVMWGPMLAKVAAASVAGAAVFVLQRVYTFG